MAITHSWAGDGLAAGPLSTASAGPGDVHFDQFSGAPQIVAAGSRPPRIEVDVPDEIFYWNLSVPRSIVSGRVMVTTPTAWVSGASIPIFGTITATVTNMFNVRLGPLALPGSFRIYDAEANLISSANNVISLNSLVRFEYQLNCTANTVVVRAYNGYSTTLLAELTAPAHTWASTINRLWWGQINAAPALPSPISYDDLAIADTAVWIGSPVPNLKPTITAPASAACRRGGAPITITATGADPDGSVSDTTGYSWSVQSTSPTGGATVTLSNTSNRTVTVTPPAAGATNADFGSVVTLSVSCVDDQGLASDPTTVLVYLQGIDARVIAIRSGASNFSVYGGAADLIAALNDGLATTGVMSPSVGGVYTMVADLSPLPVGSPVTASFNGLQTQASPQVVHTLNVVQQSAPGSPLADAGGVTSVTQAPTTADAPSTALTIPSANVSDSNRLALALTATVPA